MTMRISLGRRPKEPADPDASEQRRLDSLPNIAPITVTEDEGARRARGLAEMAARGRAGQERLAALERARRSAQDAVAAADNAINTAINAGDAEAAIVAEMRRIAAANVVEKAARARAPRPLWARG